MMNMQNRNNFVAIDFETATGNRNSACAVGIVTFENGEISEEFYSLIQPPNNEYHWGNIRVHGIREEDTANEAFFKEVFPEIYKRLKGKTIVAHNESFDRSVLSKSMEFYGISAPELQLQNKWECTFRIYKAKGFKPANLAACCNVMDIELQHHEALSDARACGCLYYKR
jgi:DNA polymerase-3 subunit epsilon